MVRQLGWITCGIAALALVASGCGSDNKSGTSSTVAATTAAPAETTSATASTGTPSLGPDAPDPRIKVAKKKIGVVDLTRAGSPIDNNTDLTIESAGKALGWDVQVIDAQGDPQKVARAAQTLVNQKVDGIITLSVDAPLIRQALTQARSNNIATCAVQGGQAPNDLYDAQYTENERNWGEVSANYFTNLNPKSKIISLKSTTIFAGKERVAGFNDALKSAPGSSVVFAPEIDLTDPIGSTTKNVEDGLTAHPDANTVWPVYDVSVASSAAALKRSGKTDIANLGQFATPPTLAALQGDTSVKAIVINPISKGAATCIDQFLKVFQDGKKMDRNALAAVGGIKNEVLTQDQVASRLVKDLPKNANVDHIYPPGVILDPFLTEWRKSYPAS